MTIRRLFARDLSYYCFCVLLLFVHDQPYHVEHAGRSNTKYGPQHFIGKYSIQWRMTGRAHKTTVQEALSSGFVVFRIEDRYQHKTSNTWKKKDVNFSTSPLRWVVSATGGPHGSPKGPLGSPGCQFGGLLNHSWGMFGVNTMSKSMPKNRAGKRLFCQLDGWGGKQGVQVGY